MSTQPAHSKFTRHAYARARSTAAVLAIAAVGYVAGAIVQQGITPRSDAAFAQPARSADFDINDALPPVGSLAMPPSIAQPQAFNPESTLMPRECSVEEGVVTTCVFMD